MFISDRTSNVFISCVQKKGYTSPPPNQISTIGAINHVNWKDTVLDDSSIYNNFVCSIDLIVEFGTEGLEGEEYELQF